MACAIYLIAENRNKVTLTVADLFVVIANRLLKPGQIDASVGIKSRNIPDCQNCYFYRICQESSFSNIGHILEHL